MHKPDPTFPPLFKGHPIKAPLTARNEACRLAARGELGAGDLVWSRNTSKAECALILEPEVPLSRACQMMPLGFIAMAEMIGHVGPPQLPVEVLWPGSVLVDGGVCGHVGLTAPPTASDVVPAWLVLDLSVTLSFSNDRREPGERQGETALDLQGAGDVTRTMALEALAPPLLAWLHTWSTDGFRPIHDQWVFRAAGRDREPEADIDGIRGTVIGLDEDANVLLRKADGRVTSRAYLPHLQVWS